MGMRFFHRESLVILAASLLLVSTPSLAKASAKPRLAPYVAPSAASTTAASTTPHATQAPVAPPTLTKIAPRKVGFFASIGEFFSHLFGF